MKELAANIVDEVSKCCEFPQDASSLVVAGASLGKDDSRPMQPVDRELAGKVEAYEVELQAISARVTEFRNMVRKAVFVILHPLRETPNETLTTYVACPHLPAGTH